MTRQVRPARIPAIVLAIISGFGVPGLIAAHGQGAAGSRAATPGKALQAKIDARVQAIQTWAADPTIVGAVRAINANPPAEYAAMTQQKWAGLSVLSPFVRTFTTNDAATRLKKKLSDEVSEFFLSSANGCKVAFLAKPTNWSHRGKAKHDVPMSGKAWQGAIETDQSTGVQQVQVAVPVLDGGKPIGSLVVGLAVSRLQ